MFDIVSWFPFHGKETKYKIIWNHDGTKLVRIQGVSQGHIPPKNWDPKIDYL